VFLGLAAAFSPVSNLREKYFWDDFAASSKISLNFLIKISNFLIYISHFLFDYDRHLFRIMI